MREKRFHKLLYQSFDRELTPAGREALERGLRESGELRKMRDRLQSLAEMPFPAASNSFNPWFADRTMNRIRQLTFKEKQVESLFNGLFPGFRRIALIAGFALVLILGFNLSTSSRPDIADVLGFTRYSMTEMADPITYFTLE